MQQRLPCASELTKDCPYQRYEPQTLQGWQAWDTGVRLQVTGDRSLSVALNLAEALGYDLPVLAEMLPFVLAAFHPADPSPVT